jgi:hypothetical protein
MSPIGAALFGVFAGAVQAVGWRLTSAHVRLLSMIASGAVVALTYALTYYYASRAHNVRAARRSGATLR